MPQFDSGGLTICFSIIPPYSLEPGVVLPPGYYPATEVRHGLETIGGDVTWAEPRYKIEFSAKELAKIGVKGAASRIFVKYDVTVRVRSGELTVGLLAAVSPNSLLSGLSVVVLLDWLSLRVLLADDPATATCGIRPKFDKAQRCHVVEHHR
jgi:hypothetical protein